MPSFRLTLEYDGSAFEGWQVQPARPGRRTVQGILEEALARVTGQRVRVTGSGRTDAGVHAEGQVASLRVETRLDADTLRRALNGVLPHDVAALAVEPAEPGFHALRDARAKLYRYQIWNGPLPSPLRRARSAWVPRPLDLPAMRRAASALAGTHDFAAFQASGSPVASSVRRLSRLDATGRGGGEIALWAEADGFLRCMVRILAGTLIEVGRGRLSPQAMGGILASRERARAGPTVPARGLTLVRVTY